jgi:phosphatidylserine/phosphatidylglycerophosphate/cardiolipin synthase-like enzyme
VSTGATDGRAGKARASSNRHRERRLVAAETDGVELRLLTDGGQPALDIAQAVAAFVGRARRSLDLALYDLRLHDETADVVRSALVGAAERGVRVRLAYNLDHRRPMPVPPPPRTEPSLIESLPLPTLAIPGVPDLMHHKFVVRDGEAIWTGSTNWTEDAWSRQENVVVTVVSPRLAGRYQRGFERLWTTRKVRRSGRVRTWPAVRVGGAAVRPWFCPRHGKRLARRIARAILGARRRIRIASPVITSGPILRALLQRLDAGDVDLAGVVDGTQMAEVLRHWARDNPDTWKAPLVRDFFGRSAFTGKRSTPYAPDALHDYMHAKITVCDGTVFVGSFNLSRSGEDNAEDVLELQEPALAERLAAFVDEVQPRYPPLRV